MTTSEVIWAILIVAWIPILVMAVIGMQRQHYEWQHDMEQERKRMKEISERIHATDNDEDSI